MGWGELIKCRVPLDSFKQTDMNIEGEKEFVIVLSPEDAEL